MIDVQLLIQKDIVYHWSRGHLILATNFRKYICLKSWGISSHQIDFFLRQLLLYTLNWDQVLENPNQSSQPLLHSKHNKDQITTKQLWACMQLLWWTKWLCSTSFGRDWGDNPPHCWQKTANSSYLNNLTLIYLQEFHTNSDHSFDSKDTHNFLSPTPLCVRVCVLIRNDSQATMFWD